MRSGAYIVQEQIRSPQMVVCYEHSFNYASHFPCGRKSIPQIGRSYRGSGSYRMVFAVTCLVRICQWLMIAIRDGALATDTRVRGRGISKTLRRKTNHMTG
jgi:hypothetical protein